MLLHLRNPPLGPFFDCRCWVARPLEFPGVRIAATFSETLALIALYLIVLSPQNCLLCLSHLVTAIIVAVDLKLGMGQRYDVTPFSEPIEVANSDCPWCHFEIVELLRTDSIANLVQQVYLVAVDRVRSEERLHQRGLLLL